MHTKGRFESPISQSIEWALTFKILLNISIGGTPIVLEADYDNEKSAEVGNSNSAPIFSDVRDHLLKVIDEVELMDELIDAALHANSTLIQVQQNTDMRKISAWVGIGAVPTMVAGIYGMNFDHMPELRWRYGYFIVVGFLVAVCATLFRLFRKNEWL